MRLTAWIRAMHKNRTFFDRRRRHTQAAALWPARRSASFRVV